MLIDWFTVGAQALNFLVLVWLMKRFLYKPILSAIDTREALIAGKLADAAAKEKKAAKEHADFQHKSDLFDRQRAHLLSKATDEANAERERLIAEAKKAADAVTVKRQHLLRTDAHELNQTLMRHTQDEVFAIARKTLAELATASLEERVADVFVRRVRAMRGAAKSALADALAKTDGPALVRSAFELPTAQRAAIQAALDETLSVKAHLRFETAPDVVSGIELTAHGQKVAWSIAEYLTVLEQKVDDLLTDHDRASADGKPKPKAKPKSKPTSKAKPKPKPKPTTKTKAKAKAKAPYAPRSTTAAPRTRRRAARTPKATSP